MSPSAPPSYAELIESRLFRQVVEIEVEYWARYTGHMPHMNDIETCIEQIEADLGHEEELPSVETIQKLLIEDARGLFNHPEVPPKILRGRPSFPTLPLLYGCLGLTLFLSLLHYHSLLWT